MVPNETHDLRPADWARWVLASSARPPRTRARDQHADRLGEDLRRWVLGRIAALDPAPEELDQALMTIVAASPIAQGPARAIALSLRQEWDDLVIGPALRAFLLNEALAAGEDRRGGSE